MENPRPLEGAHAIVMGIHDASGWEAVHALQEAGAVVAAYTTLYEAGSDLSGEGFSGWCDTADHGRVEAVMDIATQRLPHLKVLVNLADMPLEASLEDTSPEDFDRVLQANLTYITQTTRAALPVMARSGGGAIVNVISGASRLPHANQTAYASAQGGVPAFTRATALDSKDDHIRANCLAAEYPIKDPQAFAQAILLLATDQSRYITGSLVSLDEALTVGKTV